MGVSDASRAAICYCRDDVMVSGVKQGRGVQALAALALLAYSIRVSCWGWSEGNIGWHGYHFSTRSSYNWSNIIVSDYSLIVTLSV